MVYMYNPIKQFLMATIKIKFRPSSANAGEGTIYYQIIHNRVARQIKTGYRVMFSEWERFYSEPPAASPERAVRLAALKRKVAEDTAKLEGIIASLEQKGAIYTSDDVVSAFLQPDNGTTTFFSFMRSEIFRMKKLGRHGIAEAYSTSLNSFVRFREGMDMPLSALDADITGAYEAWVKEDGVSRNTSSFYMRNLRAVYNRAVKKGLTPQRDPFREVYTGIDKTVKRAVPLTVIKRMKALDLSLSPMEELARDMFLFSFYTRGMSFVDMAYLKKKDVQNGILSYRRRKTGQLLSIRWEKCMAEIAERYDTEDSDYLLPLIRKPHEARKQYRNASHLINNKLKLISNRLKLSVPLTMYVARHAWASIARSKNIPLSVISEGMGHDSENTTRIYLASLDTAVVDKANRIILKAVE